MARKKKLIAGHGLFRHDLSLVDRDNSIDHQVRGAVMKVLFDFVKAMFKGWHDFLKLINFVLWLRK